MASSAGFKDFVLECLQSCESGLYFSERKMFGEYCLYFSSGLDKPKPCFLLCDDRLFVKAHKELETLLANNEKAPPFPKARLWYVLDPEDRETLQEVLRILEMIL